MMGEKVSVALPLATSLNQHAGLNQQKTRVVALSQPDNIGFLPRLKPWASSLTLCEKHELTRAERQTFALN
jgi:hypothetical protein